MRGTAVLANREELNRKVGGMGTWGMGSVTSSVLLGWGVKITSVPWDSEKIVFESSSS
jgi:hypothetical protein